MTRYIFVTGGVVSSLGKGLASAALASLLQAHGYKVRIRKFDPYINVDPGTMSPSQHGEVYVTVDGAETDLDLGHYERFTNVPCRKSDNITTGRLYSHVIGRERRGDYLGATVQVIPHITNAIKAFITDDLDEDLDFLICEVGGTVGDIEGLPFLEAIRQFIHENGHDRCLFMHLTLVPYIPSADELKTKPSQHSVKELLRVGIQPDILLCRCDREIPEEAKSKLALFCNIHPERVIEALDVKSIYQVPISYSKNGLDREVLRYFDLPVKKDVNLSHWAEIVDKIENSDKEVTIAVVGKYMMLKDAYKSINEALVHGGIANSTRVKIKWVDAETLESGPEGVRVPKGKDEVEKIVGPVDGVLVPGGYGLRGTAGMLAAIRWAREDCIPFMGICLGMQLAVVEAARNVAGLKEANSTEFGATPHPVVGLMTEWAEGDRIEVRHEKSDLGGTMRLGEYECHITPDSLAHKVYGKTIIRDRHRHRYEVNIGYKDLLQRAGLHVTGVTMCAQLPEMVERKDHPWFLAMQFHPELASRPFSPHPVFKGFIGAAVKKTEN